MNTFRRSRGRPKSTKVVAPKKPTKPAEKPLLSVEERLQRLVGALEGPGLVIPHCFLSRGKMLDPKRNGGNDLSAMSMVPMIAIDMRVPPSTSNASIANTVRAKEEYDLYQEFAGTLLGVLKSIHNNAKVKKSDTCAAWVEPVRTALQKKGVRVVVVSITHFTGAGATKLDRSQFVVPEGAP